MGQPTKAAISLFMWGTGSVFDIVLNSFTNDPAPMIPAPGNGVGVKLTSVGLSGGVKPEWNETGSFA